MQSSDPPPRSVSATTSWTRCASRCWCSPRTCGSAARNRSFYRSFAVDPTETEGRLVYELGNGQWDIPALRQLLEDVLPERESFDDFEVTHDFPSVGRKVMLLNARRVVGDGDGRAASILLAIEDITERRRLEDERREIETRFTSLVKNVRDHSIFALDPRGHVTSWNVEAERILGFSGGRGAGAALLDHLHRRGQAGRHPRARASHRPERRPGRRRALAHPQGRRTLLGPGHRDADPRRQRQAHRLLENPAGHDRPQAGRGGADGERAAVPGPGDGQRGRPVPVERRLVGVAAAGRQGAGPQQQRADPGLVRAERRARRSRGRPRADRPRHRDEVAVRDGAPDQPPGRLGRLDLLTRGPPAGRRRARSPSGSGRRAT